MAYIHQHQGRFVSFQSAWRWGGVGLLITASSPATAGPLFRFNPLGGGAGSGDSPPSGPQKRARFVSIPSEVGRGRSGLCPRPPHNVRVSFQSPRRWGGVGRDSTPGRRTMFEFRFNPLGGGAGSGSHIQHMQKAMEQMTSRSFQSPRRWGGVGLVHQKFITVGHPFRFNPLGGGAGSATSNATMNIGSTTFRFNPLGGGAGSGCRFSPTHADRPSFRFNPLGGGAGSARRSRWTCLRPSKVSFQSPRRWGGVGLSLFANACRPTLVSFQSPRRWGGVGKAVAM